MAVYITAAQKVSHVAPFPWKRRGKLAELTKRGLLESIVMDVILIAGI
jgi:hypothetical protein